MIYFIVENDPNDFQFGNTENTNTSTKRRMIGASLKLDSALDFFNERRELTNMAPEQAIQMVGYAPLEDATETEQLEYTSALLAFIRNSMAVTPCEPTEEALIKFYLEHKVKNEVVAMLTAKSLLMSFELFPDSPGELLDPIYKLDRAYSEWLEKNGIDPTSDESMERFLKEETIKVPIQPPVNSGGRNA